LATPETHLYQGNCARLTELDIQADLCITSPPYFQKFDYELDEQFGLEETVESYLETQVAVFAQIRRLLVEGGTCFIVIGDTSNNYSPVRAKHQRKTGHNNWKFRRKLQPDYQEKEMLNVPLRLANALRQNGWVHRNTLIWNKGVSGVMANSDTAPQCHEYILHLIKWTPNGRPYGNTKPLKSSVLTHPPGKHQKHGCVYPESLVEELLTTIEPPKTIIDPYLGSGTTAIVAAKQGHIVYGIDLDLSIAIEELTNQGIAFDRNIV
jgi:DNA modification methylase